MCMLSIPTELIIPFPEILYVTQLPPKIIFCCQCICGCMCFLPKCSSVECLIPQSSYTVPDPPLPCPWNGRSHCLIFQHINKLPVRITLNPCSLLSFWKFKYRFYKTPLGLPFLSRFHSNILFPNFIYDSFPSCGLL